MKYLFYLFLLVPALLVTSPAFATHRSASKTRSEVQIPLRLQNPAAPNGLSPGKDQVRKRPHKSRRVPKVTLKRARLRKAFRIFKFRKRPHPAQESESEDPSDQIEKNGLGIASIALAGLSGLFFWMPFLGAGLGAAGILLGLIGTVADDRPKMATIGLVASVFMFLVGLGWTMLFMQVWRYIWF